MVEEDDRLARVVPLKMAFPKDNMEIISREDKGRACVAMQSGLVPTPPLCDSCGCVSYERPPPLSLPLFKACRGKRAGPRSNLRDLAPPIQALHDAIEDKEHWH